MTVFNSPYQRLLLAAVSILLSASFLVAHGQNCLRTLSEFDVNVTSDRDNVDRLTGGFYPTNRPSPLVADICYYVNSTSATDVPAAREANFQIPCDADGRSVYRFRYTETPVFLFVSHEAVEAYSFFAVSVDIPVIHIAVGPLCNDIVLELLNSGTALLKNHARARGSGFVLFKGYASYFNPGISAFEILGDIEQFQGNVDIFFASFVFYVIFAVLGVPAFLHSNYKRLSKASTDPDSNLPYTLWGLAATSAILLVVVAIVDYPTISRTLSTHNPDNVLFNVYIITQVVIVAVIVINFVLAAIVVLPKKQHIQLPPALQVLFCTKYCKFGSKVAQILATGIFSTFFTVLGWHVAFFFLAFAAFPARAILVILLYVAGIFFIVAFFSYFFKIVTCNAKFCHAVADRAEDNLGLQILFPIAFVGAVIFIIMQAVFFFRITVFIGATDAGGIPTIIGALGPATILGVLGVGTAGALKKYNPKNLAERLVGRTGLEDVLQGVVPESENVEMAATSAEKEASDKEGEPATETKEIGAV